MGQHPQSRLSYRARGWAARLDSTPHPQLENREYETLVKLLESLASRVDELNAQNRRLKERIWSDQ